MKRQQKPNILPSEPTIAIANVYTVIAGIATVFFAAFFYWIIKNQILSILMVLVLGGVIINYFILRLTKNYKMAAYSLLSMGAFIMLCLFAGGWESMGLVWPFAWLPATYWMTKGKGSRIFTLILVVGCLIIVALHSFGIINLPYSSLTMINFFAALIVFSVLMILYQKATINYETFLAYTRKLFETSLDPIITVDVAGNILDLNQITEKITEISRERLIATNLAIYFTDPRKVNEFLKQALTKGAVHNFPLTLRHYGKEIITDVLANATIYQDEKSKVQKIFIVMRDITERQEAERRKEELLTELEKVNRDLESFTYSVAHDLRAPLRTINGFTAIIGRDYKDKVDDEGRRLMDKVIGESKRMGKLIDDLLAFSRVGKKEIQKSDIDMTALANAVLEDFPASDLKNKSITISDLPHTIGDNTFLRQVFVNLISNALKYTQLKNNPIIEIDSYTKDNENIYFVRDNGAGFEMEYYDKLFNVFQRLHSQDEFEGTGVGLAIVNRIISRHGGKVWAEGKVNEGATFYFSLPKT